MLRNRATARGDVTAAAVALGVREAGHAGAGIRQAAAGGAIGGLEAPADKEATEAGGAQAIGVLVTLNAEAHGLQTGSAGAGVIGDTPQDHLGAQASALSTQAGVRGRAGVLGVALGAVDRGLGDARSQGPREGRGR